MGWHVQGGEGVREKGKRGREKQTWRSCRRWTPHPSPPRELGDNWSPSDVKYNSREGEESEEPEETESEEAEEPESEELVESEGAEEQGEPG